MHFLFMSLLCLAGNEFPNAFKNLKTFDVTGIAEELQPTIPRSFDFDKQGRLYVLARDTHRIYIWNTDGKLHKVFGSKGNGPGEFRYPMRLAIHQEMIWVVDNLHKKCMRFDLEGNYLDSFQMFLYNFKNFAIVGDNFLVPYSSTDGNPESSEQINFDIYDRTGKRVHNLLSFDLKDVVDLNHTTNRHVYASYYPDYDIQRDEKGRLFVGFSTKPILYEINTNGTLGEKHAFKLVTRPPKPQEVEIFEDYGWKGADFDYERPMSYYTHFLLKEDKVLFVLTPIGGGIGSPHGFHHGSYRICDRKSGEVIKKGTYSYPEGSMVFYRNGRIIVFFQPPEEEPFQVHEVQLIDF